MENLYCTLARKDPETGKYVDVFVSDDYQDCVEEMDDFKDNDLYRTDYEILKTSDDQESIVEALKDLNERG